MPTVQGVPPPPPPHTLKLKTRPPPHAIVLSILGRGIYSAECGAHRPALTGRPRALRVSLLVSPASVCTTRRETLAGQLTNAASAV